CQLGGKARIISIIRNVGGIIKMFGAASAVTLLVPSYVASSVSSCISSSMARMNSMGEIFGFEDESQIRQGRKWVLNGGLKPKSSISKTPEEELEESNEMDVKSKRVKKDLQVSYNQCLNSLSASEQITNMFVPSQVLARVEERPPGQLQSVFKQLVSIRTAVHHNPDGDPLGSEVEHLRRHPRPPVPNSPGKINVGYCTGSSLFQKAVHHNPDGEPLGSEVEHLRRHPRPPVPNSPGKINVGYCTGSSLFQKVNGRAFFDLIAYNEISPLE
ncbi:hypothetical protein STEG23_031653, partial [Scotinomys teguina]